MDLMNHWLLHEILLGWSLLEGELVPFPEDGDYPRIWTQESQTCQNSCRRPPTGGSLATHGTFITFGAKRHWFTDKSTVHRLYFYFGMRGSYVFSFATALLQKLQEEQHANLQSFEKSLCLLMTLDWDPRTLTLTELGDSINTDCHLYGLVPQAGLE